MKVETICAAIDELAPPGLAYPWDHSGLAVGSMQAEVSRVLVALTLTPEAFRAAVRAKAELIVVHHPPIWEPLARLCTADDDTRLFLEVAEKGMACFAAHTNLDVAPGGINDAVADRLGLVKREPLLPVPHAGQVKLVTFVPEAHLAHVRRAVCERGAGSIGEYTFCSFSSTGIGTFLPSDKAKPFSGRKEMVNEEPERRFEVLVPEWRLREVVAALKEAHPYEEVAYDVYPVENDPAGIGLGVRGEVTDTMALDAFAEEVRQALALSHVRVVNAPGKAAKRRVRKVGVLAGSGGGDLGHMPPGLDVVVTGDVKYHDALTARARELAVIDAGHAGMEKWVVPLLAKCLREKFRHLRVSSYTEPDLFRVISD